VNLFSRLVALVVVLAAAPAAAQFKFAQFKFDLGGSADELLEPEKAFRFSARALDPRAIEVHFAIADGYYMYRDKFKFALAPGASASLGAPQFPAGIRKKDEFFGEVETYRKDVRIRIPVERGVAAAQAVELNVTSQGCADLGVCYTPMDSKASIFLAALAGPGAGEVQLRARAWYNPDLRSRNFYVPGVMAILIMLTSLLLTSMAIVREREIGTMEQLMVTPIRPVELILGKTLPFALIGFFDVALITAVAVFWFAVPIRGSLLLLCGATALYLLSALGIGLFISTVSRTQQQALMTTFFFFQPAMLLSGFVFPIANMPEAIQYLTYLNPLRYFLVIIRGIFLKGSGADVLWPHMLALFLLGSGVLTVSALRFRKRLE